MLTDQWFVAMTSKGNQHNTSGTSIADKGDCRGAVRAR